MMDRRSFVTTVALGLLAASLAAEAQPPKVPRIGVLSGSFPNDDPCLDALRRGLNEIGHVEGPRMGRMVKRLREKREWSQPELAKRAKVSQAYLAEIERGTKTNPSLPVLRRLAKALGVPVTELLE